MISIPINIPQSSRQPYYRMGIPFPIGGIKQLSQLRLLNSKGAAIPLQSKVTGRWVDGSVRWGLFDFFLSKESIANGILTLTSDHDMPSQTAGNIAIEHADNYLIVNTGRLKVKLDKSGLRPFSQVTVNDTTIIQDTSDQSSLIDDNGTRYQAVVNDTQLPVDTDVLRATISQRGTFQSKDGKNIALFTSDLTFFANSATVQWEFTIHNQQAAIHPGGLWDLGDANSIYFRQLELLLKHDISSHVACKPDSEMQWYEQHLTEDNSSLTIHQESSGGKHWDSKVHVNRFNKVPLRYKGYKIQRGDSIVAEGERAQPTISVDGKEAGISVRIDKFWQNFPKAITADRNSISLGIFPELGDEDHELQGGEKKRHRIWLDFGGNRNALDWTEYTVMPQLPLQWYQECNILSYISTDHPKTIVDNIIQEGLEGDSNFFNKREIIDEYGWRNFGDIFADHESLYLENGELFVSHYNNQYDPLYGFLRQFIYSGDPRWYELATELAQHLKDIDIYNTDADRVGYNGGLFWHTDHYVDAFTSSHRTLSKMHDNHPGGGPGTEHCYSRGLLYHYYFTGDESSRAALLSMAEWITELHEGSGSILEWLLRFKNKDIAKIKSVRAGEKILKYKYPLTRGTGNYINTLIDAYWVTEDADYIQRIEAIIQNTAHPDDNVDDRNLDDIELGWSYTVFLQSITYYLQLKEQLNQSDDQPYNYAKGILLDYVSWMVDNEYPFLDKPDILGFPNSTWKAQEIRKTNLFYAASKYDIDNKTVLLEKARFFLSYLEQGLRDDGTRCLARILIILMQNHGPHHFILESSVEADKPSSANTTPSKKVSNYSPYHTISSLISDFLRDIGKCIINFSPTKELNWLATRINFFKRFTS